jgi:hypothetical protein
MKYKTAQAHKMGHSGKQKVYTHSRKTTQFTKI